MYEISVENVSLVFPLYGRAYQSEAAPANPYESAAAPHDERIIHGRDGRIIGVKALTDISFSLKSGDRLALIGANGSGKTTLLQILAGILTPDRGQVRVRGRASNLININLGMRPEASGHRNITLRSLAAGHTSEEIEEKREEIAAFSELGEFLDMPIETYSAGMRMRLNFAIATAYKPEILILDEWISAGDAAFRTKASQRMQEFVAEAGILVLASHSRQMLMENCERCIWLDRGRIRADGPVQSIIEAYEAEVAPQTDAAAKAERRARRKSARAGRKEDVA